LAAILYAVLYTVGCAWICGRVQFLRECAARQHTAQHCNYAQMSELDSIAIHRYPLDDVGLAHRGAVQANASSGETDAGKIVEVVQRGREVQHNSFLEKGCLPDGLVSN